jgi:hypothetical protein
VQKGAASTLFTGPGDRRLLFVWCLQAKLQGIDTSHHEELGSEILTSFHGIPSEELKSHSMTGSKDENGLPQKGELLSIIAITQNILGTYF